MTDVFAVVITHLEDSAIVSVIDESTGEQISDTVSGDAEISRFAAQAIEQMECEKH